MELIYSLNEIDSISQKISNKLENKVVTFKGPMGSGKTTMIKSICRQLGFDDNVSSPTFSIVNSYENSSNDMIFHLDLYRIEKIEELMDIGIEEYLDSGNWCFIEWPEIIDRLLNFKHTQIELSILNNFKRRIKIK
ncbi:MAG: tRNA (adenosine(37)-N6)-threonylcarbamoyltransferase complex ATPase subunit type 1 TsaE [Flavobacteriaceae bacterium]|nr:tRNA (adenosine(37)-N6)-threonylcarbamoyltransferase complex ATPase subunit type 1 TsaE [Flavobacteriaceae bacterium]